MDVYSFLIAGMIAAPVSSVYPGPEGLALQIAREIWRILGDIRAHGIATLIVDKNYRAVTAIADRNVILVKRRVVFEGNSRTLLAQPDVLHRHLGV